MKNSIQFRQGDVFLMKVNAIPENAKKVALENGRIVLAHGEVTGHAHTLSPKAATLFSTEKETFLQVDETSALTHQEHNTITITPGNYKVVRQREYTPEAIRNVAD